MQAGDLTLFGALDALVIPLGINDNGGNATTVQANASAAISYAMAAQPNAIIIVFGPWRAPNKTTTTTIANAIAAGYAAVADPSRMCYVDTFATPTYQDASGLNSTLYIGADNVHPNSAGHAYLGARMAQDVIKCLRTLAGTPYSALGDLPVPSNDNGVAPVRFAAAA